MSTVTAGCTFPVSDVAPATEPLREISYHKAIAEFLDSPIEACCGHDGRLIPDIRSHPLIAALHVAFSTHRSVSLSPDMIWLTLCQGLASHVNANTEALRHRLVNHKDKVKLVVYRDDFVKGFPDNPWPNVFSEFTKKIRPYLGVDICNLVVADFSTTGPVERAASEIVLLDTMQGYFSYELRTLCGIPSITLEGTADDWKKIALRVQEFRQFDLDWWIDALEPVLQQFAAAAEGRVDQEFWESLYKWQGPRGSGSPHVTGWIVRLFPYLNPEIEYTHVKGDPSRILHRNPWLTAPALANSGPGRDMFPSRPALAPFTWIIGEEHFQQIYPMEFIGGLIGVAQDRTTLCLRPEIGWAVRESVVA